MKVYKANRIEKKTSMKYSDKPNGKNHVNQLNSRNHMIERNNRKLQNQMNFGGLWPRKC